MIDHKEALRKGSYKGASFYVDSFSLDDSRAIAVHEIIHSDNHILEDMGKKAEKIKINAAIYHNGGACSDNVYLKRVALQSQLLRYGASRLSLPLIKTSKPYRCVSVSFNFNAEKLGMIAFTADFIEEGSPLLIGYIKNLFNLYFKIESFFNTLAYFITTLPSLYNDTSARAIKPYKQNIMERQMESLVKTTFFSIKNEYKAEAIALFETNITRVTHQSKAEIQPFITHYNMLFEAAEKDIIKDVLLARLWGQIQSLKQDDLSIFEYNFIVSEAAINLLTIAKIIIDNDADINSNSKEENAKALTIAPYRKEKDNIYYYESLAFATEKIIDCLPLGENILSQFIEIWGEILKNLEDEIGGDSAYKKREIIMKRRSNLFSVCYHLFGDVKQENINQVKENPYIQPLLLPQRLIVKK